MIEGRETGRQMKIYKVGGSVRDGLLGLSSSDEDFVVVGGSEQTLLDNGFVKVGNSFPVFMKDGKEYALARREKKNGNGHKDFSVEFGEDVTLEEDLFRRDLTINSIAEDDNGVIFDPFGGVSDLRNKTLKMVNKDSFSEDPLRVFRLARFAAKFHDWSIDQDTIWEAAKCDTSHLSSERVLEETKKAFISNRPSRFFLVLLQTGALDVWFPELAVLINVPENIKHHPEGNAFAHVLLTLDAAREQNLDSDTNEMVMFSLLSHDLGKGLTDKILWPSHHGHDKLGLKPAAELLNRLRVPKEVIKFALLFTEHHMVAKSAHFLSSSTIVKFFEKLDVIRKKNRMNIFLSALKADGEGRAIRLVFRNNVKSNPVDFWNRMLNSFLSVRGMNLSPSFSLIDGKKFGEKLHELRVHAVRKEKELFVGEMGK